MRRSVRSWGDLDQFGIHALTGEACGFAMRALCDVTAQGKALIERFLGGTVQIVADSNWNGGSGAGDHVGSVMLPWSILTDLGAFCLAYTGRDTTVVTLDGGGAMEFDGPAPGYLTVARYVRRSTAPGTGDRNQHAMSGRIQ